MDLSILLFDSEVRENVVLFIMLYEVVLTFESVE